MAEINTTNFYRALANINQVVPHLSNPMFQQAVVDVRNSKMRVASSTQYWQVDCEGVPDMQLTADKARYLEKCLDREDYALTVEETANHFLFRWENVELLLARPLSTFFEGIEEVLLKPVLTNDDLLSVNSEAIKTTVRQIRDSVNPRSIGFNLRAGEVGVFGLSQNNDRITVTLEAEYHGTPRATYFPTQDVLTLTSMLSDPVTDWKFGSGAARRPAPLLAVDHTRKLTAVLSPNK